MRDNNIDPTVQLGSVIPDDDPNLRLDRRKALLIAAAACQAAGYGRAELRDIVLSLGLEAVLTTDELAKLSIPNE